MLACRIYFGIRKHEKLRIKDSAWEVPSQPQTTILQYIKRSMPCETAGLYLMYVYFEFTYRYNRKTYHMCHKLNCVLQPRTTVTRGACLEK